jgi:hypothetical protein
MIRRSFRVDEEMMMTGWAWPALSRVFVPQNFGRQQNNTYLIKQQF